MSDQDDVHQSLPEPVDLESPTPLTAEQIRAKAGYREEVRNVPGVGPILMRTATMQELAAMSEIARNPDGSVNSFEATIQVLILSCPALQPEDARWLRQASGATVRAIAEELEAFGLSPAEVPAVAATFRNAAAAALRVDPGEGPGDDPRPADASHDA